MPVACSELSQTIADIAMNIGADPKVRNLDDVVAVMKNDFPEFERSHVVDAIVEASSRETRTRTETSQKLEALKREARRTSEPLVRQKLTQQIADLNQKLQSPELPAARPTPQPLSKELERLAFERDKTRKQLDRRINALKPKSIFQRGAAAASEPFNLARSVMTSMDLSGVLRQGGFIALGHPVRAVKLFGPMLRAFASEQYAYRAAKEIESRPNAPLYAKAKLYLSDQGGPLSAREEGFMSRIGGKIPFVKGSERAYNTFLNKLRADSFDAMTAGLARNGEPTLDESRAIANYINVATGRGKLGPLEQASVPLNSIFFAPRYIASRFQLLAGQPLYGGSVATRKMIAGEYARYMIGVGVVYAIGAAAGGKLEDDPRSSDFGKLKFGDTRLDPLTGLSQATVFGSRMISGKTKSSTTGTVTPIRGKVPFGKPTAGDAAAQFARSKLSPLAGTAADLATGKMFGGQEVNATNEVTEKVTPMAVRDVYQAIQSEGVPKGVALGLMSLFGMGLQTYGKNGRRSARPTQTNSP